MELDEPLVSFSAVRGVDGVLQQVAQDHGEVDVGNGELVRDLDTDLKADVFLEGQGAIMPHHHIDHRVAAQLHKLDLPGGVQVLLQIVAGVLNSPALQKAL